MTNIGKALKMGGLVFLGHLGDQDVWNYQLIRKPEVRKRHFLRHLYLKCIILPRQARDKHRENSKRGRFLAAARAGVQAHAKALRQ